MAPYEKRHLLEVASHRSFHHSVFRVGILQKDSFDFWDKIYYTSKGFLVVYLNLSHDFWCGYIHLDVVHQLWQLDILPTSNGWFHTILHHEKIRGTSFFLSRKIVEILE